MRGSSTDGEQSRDSRPSGRRVVVRVVILAAILAAAALLAYRAGWFGATTSAHVAALRDRLRAVPAAPLVFIALYAIATAVALPGALLTLAGGAIFGTVLGTVLNWIGATCGAMAAYAIARWGGRDAARRLLGAHSAALDTLSEEHGFVTMLRLRLIPIVPFNVLNYAGGVSGISAGKYLAATAIGILPGTLIYTYFASALIDGASGARGRALTGVAVAGGLLFMLTFLPAIARRLGWISKRTSTGGSLVLGALLLGAPGGAHAIASTISPSRPAAAAIAFDHSAFDGLLKADVRNGLVDYDAFDRAPEFTAYLDALAHADPAAPRADELAFWIDAYNAYTIRLINKHHERESIRNINKTLGFLKAYGPWKEKLAVVGGRAYGLDEIEQDIIRARFHEPRIHFALVCAAMGCPPLRSEAYTGERLDAQLDDQARIFLLESPTKNRVDVAARTVFVSPIFIGFRDYRKDFGGSERSVAQFIAHFHPDGPAKQLLLSGDFTMVQTEYDWTLNSRTGPSRSP